MFMYITFLTKLIFWLVNIQNKTINKSISRCYIIKRSYFSWMYKIKSRKRGLLKLIYICYKMRLLIKIHIYIIFFLFIFDFNIINSFLSMNFDNAINSRRELSNNYFELTLEKIFKLCMKSFFGYFL